jgi:hypothetical protein
MQAIRNLHAVSRKFGTRAARTKTRLLDEIAATPRPSQRALRLLGETIEFIRAYPDDARVLRRVHALTSSLPTRDNVYAYSYGVARRLIRLAPGRTEIEWNAVEDDQQLLDALDLLVLPGERQGLEDTSLSLQDWFQTSTSGDHATALEALIDLLENAPLPATVRAFLYDNADLPLRYRGPSRNEIVLPTKRIHYQRGEIERERFPLAPRVRRPLVRFARGGQGLIDLALKSLCARKLEIYPLIFANPSDIVIAECGRGLRLALIGTLPEWRSPLESLYFFLLFKNGVPIAYGPASACIGCCEFGVNLFPEFRGAETRFFYAQILRTLHHRLGAEYFFLTRYGMGEDNEDALRTGAFWFYRKLGFRPTNPEIEALARAEEHRMAAEPGYRSDRRMLRRLSRTEAYLDLSAGKRRPLDFGSLGLAESRFIAERFGGDRRLAQRRCAARVARLLAVKNRGQALRGLAPLLCMIEELPRWSRRDRSALAAALRAKDAPSEARAARRLAAHPRLGAALRRLSESR